MADTAMTNDAIQQLVNQTRGILQRRLAGINLQPGDELNLDLHLTVRQRIGAGHKTAATKEGGGVTASEALSIADWP